ncbi:hypothetical protein I4U23_019891 [Adineta vaga]|nr:hypothetical protein I4U23_019891 [Adineta vaga]
MESQANFSPYPQEQFDPKNSAIQLNDQFSNTASHFSPSNNATLSSFPLQELIDFHKKKFHKAMIYIVAILGLFVLAGLILLILSFTLPQCKDSSASCTRPDITLLVIGITFTSTGILIVLLAIGCGFYQLRRQINDLIDPRITQNPIIWRLDGAEWSHYLDYIHGPNRQWTQIAPLSSFCCRQSTYHRLMDRQYGHIVLYWNGLIIDELYLVSFRQYELQNIELMNFDPNQRIHGLRIHTYLKAGKNSRDCYFDVFAPSTVSLQELQAIIQSYYGIMTDSTGARLTTLGLRLFT